MSTQYKFHNSDGKYFVTFATINWVDVFTRSTYKELILDSFRHCQKEKGLIIHAYVIMTNHIHMIISRGGEMLLQDIMRDMKKFLSFKLIGAIMENEKESRREWLISMFESAGQANSNNTKYQFWQQDNHPIELDTNFLMEQKLQYIHENPIRAGFVEKEEDWLYSSARNYADDYKELSIKIETL